MSEFRSGLKVLHKLGAGHFGEVFLGEDQVHGPVAVKVLTRQPFASDDQWAKFKAGFLAEAQYLSKATHRNVVQVFHISEAVDGNSIRLCMAYCPGGSLQEPFEAGPMPLSAVRKIATEVLMGLGALHAREMLHRDIKPANILLNQAGIAQISDFGLVTDDLLLGYGSQAGYSDHIAYEVWQGGKTSIRTDVWAFGMTLYRLLHGKEWYEEHPRPRDTIRYGGFADTLKWLPHVPKGWRGAIRSMLNDNSADRYQTAGQALEAIGRLPVDPSWETTVSPELIRWKLPSSKRLNVVEWRRHGPRRHEWTAWSEAIGAGRKKTLGGSNGIVGQRQALAELKSYFGS